MISLIIHQTAHSQYEHLVKGLIARGDSVFFICQHSTTPLPGVRYLHYVLPPLSNELISQGLAIDFIAATQRAAAVAALCEQLESQNIHPDVIYGHSGWGELLYVKDVFPAALLISYVEYYYHPTGLDIGFDAEFDPLFLDRKKLQARNAALALSLLRADLSTTPTRWQRSVLPAPVQASVRVLHEGIDTAVASPNAEAQFTVPQSGLRLSRKDKVVTYVARTLEPYRGFPTFMRALPKFFQEFPDAHVVVVGAEGTTYGVALPDGSSYQKILLAELEGRIPLGQVHFCGTVSREAFLGLLQISTAHVYLTYPLFLSWSCLEALSAGCVVIGSRTGPVTDVIEHERNGLLVDFFDVEALSDTLIDAVAHPRRYTQIRKRARESVMERFDLHGRCLPAWLALAGSIPQPQFNR